MILYPELGHLTHDGRQVPLSRSKCRLLYAVFSVAPAIAAQDFVVEYIWRGRTEPESSINAVRVLAAQIRSACRRQGVPMPFSTVRGTGLRAHPSAVIVSANRRIEIDGVLLERIAGFLSTHPDAAAVELVRDLPGLV